MTRRSILFAGVAGAFAIGAGAAWLSASARTADCPGKVTCPLTGETICKDRCPLIDPDRPDCPGRIECPATGELVCEDRCPVKAREQTRPSCCPSDT